MHFVTIKENAALLWLVDWLFDVDVPWIKTELIQYTFQCVWCLPINRILESEMSCLPLVLNAKLRNSWKTLFSKAFFFWSLVGYYPKPLAYYWNMYFWWITASASFVNLISSLTVNTGEIQLQMRTIKISVLVFLPMFSIPISTKNFTSSTIYVPLVQSLQLFEFRKLGNMFCHTHLLGTDT